MPLPHYNSSTKSKVENNLVYKNRFGTVFIFNDDFYDYMNSEQIDICINEKEEERVLDVYIVETFETPHNFSDIDSIVIDIHSPTGDIKVRKIFEVEFTSYNQTYGSKDGKWKDEASIISLRFDIKNMDVHSYHSFCVNYYYDKCYTDSEIKKILTENTNPKKK